MRHQNRIAKILRWLKEYPSHYQVILVRLGRTSVTSWEDLKAAFDKLQRHVENGKKAGFKDGAWTVRLDTWDGRTFTLEAWACFPATRAPAWCYRDGLLLRTAPNRRGDVGRLLRRPFEYPRGLHRLPATHFWFLQHVLSHRRTFSRVGQWLGGFREIKVDLQPACHKQFASKGIEQLCGALGVRNEWLNAQPEPTLDWDLMGSCLEPKKSCSPRLVFRESAVTHLLDETSLYHRPAGKGGDEIIVVHTPHLKGIWALVSASDRSTNVRLIGTGERWSPMSLPRLVRYLTTRYRLRPPAEPLPRPAAVASAEIRIVA